MLSPQELAPNQRIVATGAAIQSPVTFEEAATGKHGIKRIEDTLFAEQYEGQTFGAHVVGAVDYDQEQDPLITENIRGVDRKEWHRSQFLNLKTQHDAMQMARLMGENALSLPDKVDGYRVASLTGSVFSGSAYIAEVDFDRIRTGDAFKFLLERVATASASEIGIHNLVAQVGTACASSATTIDLGARLLYQYRPDMPPKADIVVVSGADAPISPKNIKLFLGSLRTAGTLTKNPEEASRPLDQSADGLVVSEGAGALVLETWEGAQNRGLKEKDILAELVGVASYTDAETNTLAGIEGASRVIEEALAMGCVVEDEIVAALLHATATSAGSLEKPGGDRRELLAFRKAIGRLGLKLENFWLSATKSATGHTMGAAGVIEAYYAIRTLQTGIILPNLKLEKPIGETDGFNYPFGEAIRLKKRPDAVISTNFGFGGTGTGVVFRRFIA